MSSKTKDLTAVGIFIAIEIMMTFVPYLGFIPIPFLGINATTLHIPVIISAIVLGLKPSMIVGASFGILSVIKNTFQPVATSFVFSPFIKIEAVGMGGGFASLIIAIVPRVMIAVVTFFVYNLIIKIMKKEQIAIGVSAVLGSMTSTILVMGGIYVFFAEQYTLASASISDMNALVPFLVGVISLNGVTEAIVACVIAVPVCKILVKIKK